MGVRDAAAGASIVRSPGCCDHFREGALRSFDEVAAALVHRHARPGQRVTPGQGRADHALPNVLHRHSLLAERMVAVSQPHRSDCVRHENGLQSKRKAGKQSGREAGREINKAGDDKSEQLL